MTTALDTNVLVALLDLNDLFSERAQAALERVSRKDKLIVCPVVYAELCASPKRDEAEVDELLTDMRIFVEWDISEPTWRAATQGFRSYALKRKRQKGDDGPRRLLADFLVGAHAEKRADRLLTFDGRVYKSFFPELKILSLEAE